MACGFVLLHILVSHNSLIYLGKLLVVCGKLLLVCVVLSRLVLIRHMNELNLVDKIVEIRVSLICSSCLVECKITLVLLNCRTELSCDFNNVHCVTP